MIRKFYISAMALILSTGLLSIPQIVSARDASPISSSRQNNISQSDKKMVATAQRATPQTTNRGNTYRPTTNNNSNNNGTTTRPGNSGNSNNNYRPGNSGNSNNNNNNGVRPGNNGNNNNNGYRPGNNGNSNNNGYRPGNNGNHYGDNNHNGFRPQQPGGYRPPVNPGYRPSNPGYRPYQYGHYVTPPARPYRPNFYAIPRPVYPMNYRPYVKAPIINSILGLAFGIAYNASLDYLYNRGYSIDGYDNGNIYLRDVREMGYNWEDGILSYNQNGRLYSAQFVSSLGYENPNRYRNLYNNLCIQYGNPIEGGNNTYTWFGRNGESYVTLQYYSQYTNGYSRFYTTLTYSYH